MSCMDICVVASVSQRSWFASSITLTHYAAAS
jgi:hypothetical protein